MNTMNPGRPSPRQLQRLALAALLALAGPAAMADEDELMQLALAQPFELDDATFDFAQDELGSERVVKAAPYCADAVHETVQPLNDGNRIVRKQQTRLCRDGEGRTRQEVERNGRKLVWLRDPVAKQAWLLDPARKTARRLGSQGHAMWFNEAAVEMANAEEWRAFAERAREQAREMAGQAREQAKVLGERAASDRAMAERLRGRPLAPIPPVPPVAPTAAVAATPNAAPVIVTRALLAGEAPDGRSMEIQVLRLGEEAMPAPPGHPHPPMAMPVPPPVIHWQAQHAAPRGQGVLSSLGSKDIEGVRANGERTTWTIEAGKIGNEKPIQIVREVWTSPELLLTVQSRDADPRRGETVYRLANLKRGEPDAALMKVPADYAASGTAAAPSVPATPGAPATPGIRKPAVSGSAPKG